MAIDLALLDRAGAGGVATVRIYDWTRPTVSFGRNERVRDTWDVEAMRRDDLDVVRRPTGGRALLHGADLTYAVVLPLPRAVPWRAAYDAVNARLLQALHRLGVPATLVADAAPVAPEGVPCFAAPASGELTVAGRKLAGSAVWRGPHAYLQHGSLLLHDTQGRLARYRLEAPGPTSPTPDVLPTAMLSAWCARDTACRAVQEALAGPGADTDCDASVTLTSATHRRVLAASAWLWRR